MPRQFFFGCSFTAYRYPTWADILVKNSDIESYNYGIAGASNETIAKTVTFADCKHNFTEDDEIYIMWTHWWRKNIATREGAWGFLGNAFCCGYPRSFVRRTVNYTDLSITNATAIILTNKAYTIKKNLHWKPLGDFEGGEYYFPSDGETDTIKYAISFIPEDDILPPYDDNVDIYWKSDSHPTIPWHLELAEKITEIKPNVKDWALEIHARVSSLTRREFQDPVTVIWEQAQRRAYNW